MDAGESAPDRVADMASAKRLIVGLGNPGIEYESTRHNVGFWVVDALAEKARATMQSDKGPASSGVGRLRSRPVCLVKPMGYMNRSGSVVRHYMKRLGISKQDLLVVVDDINLDLGVLRIRQKGSSGGHNGVQDIIDCLGSDDFPRLRLGIGNDFERGYQADYVLSTFREDEVEVIEKIVQKARDAATVFVCEGIVPAMNRFNK